MSDPAPSDGEKYAELIGAATRLVQEKVLIRHNHDGTICILAPESFFERLEAALAGLGVEP